MCILLPKPYIDAGDNRMARNKSTIWNFNFWQNMFWKCHNWLFLRFPSELRKHLNCLSRYHSTVARQVRFHSLDSQRRCTQDLLRLLNFSIFWPAQTAQRAQTEFEWRRIGVSVVMDVAPFETEPSIDWGALFLSTYTVSRLYWVRRTPSNLLTLP